MSRFIVGSLVVALVLAVTAVAGARGPAAATSARRAAERAGGKLVQRYRGTSKAGLPISFRVVTKKGKAKVKGLAVDVMTECWSDIDDDGIPDRIVAHITKLTGSLLPNGALEVYYAPDDDTEYLVEGTLASARRSSTSSSEAASAPTGSRTPANSSATTGAPATRRRPGG